MLHSSRPSLSNSADEVLSSRKANEIFLKQERFRAPITAKQKRTYTRTVQGDLDQATAALRRAHFAFRALKRDAFEPISLHLVHAEGMKRDLAECRSAMRQLEKRLASEGEEHGDSPLFSEISGVLRDFRRCERALYRQLKTRAPELFPSKQKLTAQETLVSDLNTIPLPSEPKKDGEDQSALLKLDDADQNTGILPSEKITPIDIGQVILNDSPAGAGVLSTAICEIKSELEALPGNQNEVNLAVTKPSDPIRYYELESDQLSVKGHLNHSLVPSSTNTLSFFHTVARAVKPIFKPAIAALSIGGLVLTLAKLFFGHEDKEGSGDSFPLHAKISQTENADIQKAALTTANISKDIPLGFKVDNLLIPVFPNEATNQVPGPVATNETNLTNLERPANFSSTEEVNAKIISDASDQNKGFTPSPEETQTSNSPTFSSKDNSGQSFAVLSSSESIPSNSIFVQSTELSIPLSNTTNSVIPKRTIRGFSLNSLSVPKLNDSKTVPGQPINNSITTEDTPTIKSNAPVVSDLKNKFSPKLPKSSIIPVSATPNSPTNSVSSPSSPNNSTAPYMAVTEAGLFDEPKNNLIQRDTPQNSITKPSISVEGTLAIGSDEFRQATLLGKVEKLSFSAGHFSNLGSELSFANFSILPRQSSQSGLEARIGGRRVADENNEKIEPTISIDASGTFTKNQTTVAAGVSFNNESFMERIARNSSGGSERTVPTLGADQWLNFSFPFNNSSALYQEFRVEQETRVNFDNGIENFMAKAEFTSNYPLLGVPTTPKDLFLKSKVGALSEYVDRNWEQKAFVEIGLEGRYKKLMYGISAQAALDTEGNVDPEIKAILQYSPTRRDTLKLEAFSGRAKIDKATIADRSENSSGAMISFSHRF